MRLAGSSSCSLLRCTSSVLDSLVCWAPLAHVSAHPGINAALIDALAAQSRSVGFPTLGAVVADLGRCLCAAGTVSFLLCSLVRCCSIGRVWLELGRLPVSLLFHLSCSRLGDVHCCLCSLGLLSRLCFPLGNPVPDVLRILAVNVDAVSARDLVAHMRCCTSCFGIL